MFNRLRSIFRRTIIQPIMLNFDMDMDSEGKHIVKVYSQSDGEKQPVEKISELWNYGYREDAEVDGKHIIRTLQEADRQTLLSLKSLNPIIREDGTLEFDIDPPILKYLRHKENIDESKTSQQLKVSDELLRPSAIVSFDTLDGLKVETGYKNKETGELIPGDRLKETKDGKYIRIGNIFSKLADIRQEGKDILNKPIIRVPIKDIPEFFMRDLVIIKNEFNAVLTDLAQKIQVVSSPFTARVNIRKTEGGWLDFDIAYNAEGFVLPEGLLSKYKNDKFVQVNPTTWVAIDLETLNKTDQAIEHLNAIPTETGYRLPVSEFATLEEFVDEIGGRVEMDKAYHEFLDQLIGFEANPNFQLSEKFESHLNKTNLTLRPYQRAGIHWLNWLRANYLHGLLADDMGLGKTLEALCALRLAYEQTNNQQHSLIIAPKSVVYHWERELKRCFPYMHSYIYQGSQRYRNIFQSSLPYIVITTYETASRDIDVLSKVPFYYLILDEATKIKNPEAIRAQAIKGINAGHRLALSGTPVENRPTELWSLFSF